MKQVHVVAAVIIQDQRVFAAQRKAGGEASLLWEFPGGKPEPGESPEAALRRELQEELGVDSTTGPLLMTVHHDYPSFSLTMDCYLCRLHSTTLHLSEHLDSRWLSAAELDTVPWAPADLPVVGRVRGMLGE